MAQSSDSTNKTPFVAADTAIDAYLESKFWLRLYFEPLDEFERIARNKPSSKIDPTLPRVTDGTMASIIQETPRRVIQQLATGIITSRDNPEYAAIADVIHRYRLLPLYNRNGTALQKHWNMLSAAMMYGSSASYTFFTKTDNQWHTDFIIPYRKDILTEKGKVYGPDSNVIHMRSWYQKSDLKAILNREKAMMKADKHYQSEWNLPLLQQFMDAGASAKPADEMTPAEKEKGGDNGGYEVIHTFQKGIGAEMYSFSPRFKDGQNLRTKVNSDPRGRIPIDFEYCNIDLSNPLGRGQVELSGGVQNLIDQQMQMFQFMSTLEMAPPLLAYGNVNKASLKLRPNAIWDMGSSPNNKVEPYAPSNHAMQNFGNNYGLLKSQIMALNNTSDMTTSTQTGNATSKTTAGVKNQQSRIGITDNYLEKQHEQWYQSQSETSVNIFFAEMKGKEAIELGKDDLNEISSTYADVLIKDNKLIVDYNKMNNVTFNFKTDPSSSQQDDDNDQLQKLQEIIQEFGQNALVMNWFLGQAGKKMNVGELYVQQFERLGLKKLDKVLSDMSPEEAAAAKQAPFPIIDKPQLRLTGQIPAAAMPGALAAGGVTMQPQEVENMTTESVKLDAIYSDPNTSPLVRAQIEQKAGLQPDLGAIQQQIQQQQQQDPSYADPQGLSPIELSLKQQELAIKQQNANDNSTKTALEISKAAHQHTLDMHNAAQAVGNNQFDQQQQVQQAQQAQQQTQGQSSDQPTQPQQPAPSNTMSSPGELQPQQPQQGQLSPQDQAIVQKAHQIVSQFEQQEGKDGSGEGTPQDIDQDLTQIDGSITPQEQQLVEELLKRGFSEADVEQVVVMTRQGIPLEHAVPIIGSKYQ